MAHLKPVHRPENWCDIPGFLCSDVVNELPQSFGGGAEKRKKGLSNLREKVIFRVVSSHKSSDFCCVQIIVRLCYVAIKV